MATVMTAPTFPLCERQTKDRGGRLEEPWAAESLVPSWYSTGPSWPGKSARRPSCLRDREGRHTSRRGVWAVWSHPRPGLAQLAGAAVCPAIGCGAERHPVWDGVPLVEMVVRQFTVALLASPCRGCAGAGRQ